MQPQLFAGGPARDESGAILDDAHYTPPRAARACVLDIIESLRPPPGSSWTEPSVGEGAFVRPIRSHDPTARVFGVDIQHQAAGLELCDLAYKGADYATVSIPPCELTVGNVPFGGPDEARGRRPGDPRYVGAHHVIRAIKLSSLGVGCILPLEWQGVGYIIDTLFGPYPPAYFRVFTPRVWPYVKACAWYVWTPGHNEFRNAGPLRWK